MNGKANKTRKKISLAEYKVRVYCIGHNKTLSELAIDIGVTPQALYRWFHIFKYPKVEQLVKLRQFITDITAEDFYTEFVDKKLKKSIYSKEK